MASGVSSAFPVSIQSQHLQPDASAGAAPSRRKTGERAQGMTWEVGGREVTDPSDDSDRFKILYQAVELIQGVVQGFLDILGNFYALLCSPFSTPERVAMSAQINMDEEGLSYMQLQKQLADTQRDLTDARTRLRDMQTVHRELGISLAQAKREVLSLKQERAQLAEVGIGMAEVMYKRRLDAIFQDTEHYLGVDDQNGVIQNEQEKYPLYPYSRRWAALQRQHGITPEGLASLEEQFPIPVD